jgi:hypothetical protein
MKIDLVFWLILALSASVIVNFVVFYYARVVLGRLMFLGDNLADLTEMITSYRNHLKTVYEMEMFYGDETLEFLINHTKSLHEMLEEYEDAYAIALPPDNTEETNDNNEEINNNAEKKIPEQDVFYAGTRTSNN